MDATGAAEGRPVQTPLIPERLKDHRSGCPGTRVPDVTVCVFVSPLGPSSDGGEYVGILPSEDGVGEAAAHRG